MLPISSHQIKENEFSDLLLGEILSHQIRKIEFGDPKNLWDKIK